MEMPAWAAAAEMSSECRPQLHTSPVAFQTGYHVRPSALMATPSALACPVKLPVKAASWSAMDMCEKSRNAVPAIPDRSTVSTASLRLATFPG